MLVGFDAKRFYHNKSGLGNYSRSLVRILDEFTDVNIKLYSPYRTPPPQASISTHFYKNSFLKRERFIRKQIHKDKIDLFHGLSNEIPMGLQIPSVVTIHDVLFKRYQEDYAAFDRFIYHRKTMHAVKHATAIVCPSETTKSDLLKYYKADNNKIHVIYEAIDESFKKQRESLESSNEYYLVLATAQERKNLALVLQCYVQDQKQELLPAVILGIQKELFERTFPAYKNLLQNGRIKIPGYLEEAVLVNYYSNALAVVYPSKWEGFGIPILEAQGMQRPLLLADNPCFREIGGTAALFFDPLCPKSLKSQLLAVKEPDVASSLIQAGLVNLNRFQANLIAGKYRKLYEKILINF